MNSESWNFTDTKPEALRGETICLAIDLVHLFIPALKDLVKSISLTDLY